MRCETYQDLLLDHLYGLLDDAEATAVESHLTGCADCTAARTAAELSQSLIARAAKRPFPNVVFTPPSAEEVVVPSDLERQRGSSPHPARNSRHKTKANPAIYWARWAVAASLLLLIPAAVLPVSGWGSKLDAARRAADGAAADYAAARSVLNDAEVGVARQKDAADRRLAAARKGHDDTLTEWVGAEKAATEARAALEINRPVAVQPGAPNEFRVNVRNAGRGLVEAAVRDQDGKIIHRQQFTGENPDGHSVRMPAEVWTRVGPQAELFLTVSTTDESGKRTELQDKVRLFGPVYATLLVTDRPTYRPGERVFFRSLTLDRVSFRPPAHEQHLKFELSETTGKPVPGLSVVGSTDVVRVVEGVLEPVSGPDGKPVRGVGCGSFALPPGLPDGDYVLTLTEQKHPGGFAPTVPAPVRKLVRVRAGAIEKYQKKIGFAAAAYAPGDTVEAWCELKQQDKPVAGVQVDVEARAGAYILPAQVQPARTLKDGRVHVKFEVPRVPGDVRLKVTFKTPTGPETVTEPVPLSGRNLSVEFFPEGGDLIAGVPGRVYVRATGPDGRPVDVRGTITDGRQTVARVETLTDPKEPGVNRGLGAFSFTPQLGVSYWMTPDHPKGAFAPILDLPVAVGPASVFGAAGAVAARTGFALPETKTEGVSLTTPDAVTAPGQPVRVTVQSVGAARNLVVGAYTRGRLADTKRVAAPAGKPVEVTLMAGNDPRGGVTRITVFEDPNPDPKQPTRDLKPVAERLVFRKPGEALNLAYTAQPADGGAIDLLIAATDEKGRPAAAVVWAAVVNAANVAGPRDRLMPTHFLLAGETQSPDALEYADFLLTNHPRAAQCLDLVLATQGWRRFVEQKPPAEAEMVTTPEVARLVAMNGQRPLGMESTAAREHRDIYERYLPRYQAAVRHLDEAKKAAAVPLDMRAVAAAQRVYGERESDLAKARAAVAAGEEPLTLFRGWAWFAVGGLILVAVGLSVWVCVKPGGLGGALPLAIGGAAALGLSAYLGVAASTPKPAAAKGDMSAQSRVTSADPGRDEVKSQPKAMSVDAMPAGPVDTPGVARGPNKIQAKEAGAGPGPAVHAPALANVPDAFLQQKDPFNVKGVRGSIQLKMHSDAADDPTRQAVENAAKGRAEELAEGMTGPKLDPKALARVRAMVPRVPPLVVREYAAPRPVSTPDDVETDTVLWHPLIVLPTDGKATVTFYPGVQAGGYQVTVAGHTPDGRIGAVRGILPPPKK